VGQVSRKMITAIRNILFITVVIYLGISIAYKLTIMKLDSTIPIKTGRTRHTPITERQYRPLSDYKIITERDLLKTTPNQNISIIDQDKDKLPKTSLKLKLWGTVTGSIDKAYAIIEKLTTKGQALYRTGDTIETAVVKKILRKKVVLRMDGRDEVLEMEDGVRFSATEDVAESITTEAGTLNMKIRRASLDAAIQSRNFRRTAMIRPHFESPQVTGFKITDIKPNSILKKLGLQNGDVVTDLDGKKFRLTNEIIRYYREHTSGISIGVIRNGQKKKINYSFE